MHGSWEAQRDCADFVKNRGIEIAVLCETYGARASEIVGIEDKYAAFCLDECVGEIIMRLKRGDVRRPEKHEDNEELIKELMGHGD